MRNNQILSVLSLFAIFLLTSCEAIGGVFKAGMWAGIIVVIIVVVLVLWLMRKMRR